MANNIDNAVCDVIDICSTFPARPSPEISRGNLLDTIDRIFKGDIELVSIEGDEGYGKTSLLAQFAKRHPEECFCVFIKPVTRFSYDPSLIRSDLCNQLHWLLHGTQLLLENTPEDADVRQYFGEIQRKSKRTGKTYYVVIDGLTDIPDKDVDYRRLICDFLPIGSSGFKVLISGDAHAAIGLGLKNLHYKPFPIPSFSQHETDQYLIDLITDEKEREEIHKTLKGIPGHLSSVRRIIESGKSPSNLLDNMPEELKDLFTIEWSVVDSSDPLITKALALLAHDKRERNIVELAELLSQDPKHVEESLIPYSFIDYKKENGSISFISDTFRRFAATRLHDRRPECLSLQIDRLLKAPNSPESLTTLPDYLALSGEHDYLLNYLTIEHFERLLAQTHALVDITKQLSLGLDIAQKTNNYKTLFSLSLSKCLLLDAPTSVILKSEVEAHLSLDDYATATYLANSARFKEDQSSYCPRLLRIRENMDYMQSLN